MSDLAILVGLQASGKSTFYRLRLAGTHALVSKDLMRNNRRPSRRQAVLVTEALSVGRSVAVDNTNVTAESRRDLIGLGKAFGATVTGYFFSARLADCLARNAGRAGKERVPDVGLFSAAKAFARPSLAEGFDRLYFVTFGAEAGEFLVSDRVEEPSGDEQR